MIERSRQLAGAFTQPPNLEHARMGQLVPWIGLLAGILPCGMLLVIALISGELISQTGLYAALLGLYMLLLLLIDIRSALAEQLWRRLWVYLLVLSLVCFSLQSITSESFLQPIVFINPLIYAALAYPPWRVALVGLWLLGLMNLGTWLSGQEHLMAFLFPTAGYGTFMAFTYTFVHLSVQQAAARARADRLAAALARERDYMARLAEITATLTHDLDLATVLDQVAAAGLALAQADLARVWLDHAPDGMAEQLHLVAEIPLPPPAERGAPATMQALQSQAGSEVLVLPLIFNRATIGALELRGSFGVPFIADAARLLQPFADAAAIAIENARLYEQARLSATLSERNRLARELHDTIAQGLTAVTMQLEAAQRSFVRDPARARARIARAHELARESLEDVRRSVWTLAAPLVDGHELGSALEEVTVRFAERSGLMAGYTHNGPPPVLAHAAATQVLRIVQEALQNVEKHAQARSVEVASTVGDGALCVWVRDDGVGFAPDQPSAGMHRDGFGLLSLHERARLAGGALQVASAPGTGTRVTVTIPL